MSFAFIVDDVTGLRTPHVLKHVLNCLFYSNGYMCLNLIGNSLHENYITFHFSIDCTDEQACQVYYEHKLLNFRSYTIDFTGRENAILQASIILDNWAFSLEDRS